MAEVVAPSSLPSNSRRLGAGPLNGSTMVKRKTPSELRVTFYLFYVPAGFLLSFQLRNCDKTEWVIRFDEILKIRDISGEIITWLDLGACKLWYLPWVIVNLNYLLTNNVKTCILFILTDCRVASFQDLKHFWSNAMILSWLHLIIILPAFQAYTEYKLG